MPLLEHFLCWRRQLPPRFDLHHVLPSRTAQNVTSEQMLMGFTAYHTSQQSSACCSTCRSTTTQQCRTARFQSYTVVWLLLSKCIGCQCACECTLTYGCMRMSLASDTKITVLVLVHALHLNTHQRGPQRRTLEKGCQHVNMLHMVCVCLCLFV